MQQLSTAAMKGIFLLDPRNACVKTQDFTMNSHPFANVSFTSLQKYSVLVISMLLSNLNPILIPIVTDIECGLPASIVHGSYDLVNGSVGYLSTVIYKCHEGYEMIGRAMLTVIKLNSPIHSKAHSFI